VGGGFVLGEAYLLTKRIQLSSGKKNQNGDLGAGVERKERDPVELYNASPRGLRNGGRTRNFQHLEGLKKESSL